MGFLARFRLRKTDASASDTTDEAYVLPPGILALRPLTEADFALVQTLSSELMHSGVLDRRVYEEVVAQQSPEELTLLLADAARAAQTEQQSNADFYDPSVEEILLSKQYADKMYSEDPSLDGLDDDGIQVYETFANEARLDTPTDRVHPHFS